MALPERIGKKDASDLLDISRQTLDNRIAAGAYKWPPESWAALIEQEFERRMHGGTAADSDDARFRRARADNHEIEAAKKRGDVFPVDVAEEVVVTLFGAFIQETEGATARLQRAAPTLSEAIGREYRTFRENLARGVERCCENWRQRARAGAPAARPARGRVGAAGEGAAAGQRGAGPVQ
jgi:hypothetical protein